MVTASTIFPEHHASLSDGTTTISFKFTDGNGQVNERAFKANPYPRTALKTTTGESKYSDLEQPYFAIAQDDFTGGRGNEDFENDTSRYSDGYRVDTNKESGVILGGRETYSKGYHNLDQVMPGSMHWYWAIDQERYSAVSFVASASYTSYQCEVWLQRFGTPGNITVQLWSTTGSQPNAMLASKALTPAQVTSNTTGVSILTPFIWTGSPGLTSGTTYWVVIIGASGDDGTNGWKIGCEPTGANKTSANGSTWGNYDLPSYYRITPVAASFTGWFFEYKYGLYMIQAFDSYGNGKLYINGDRGAADSNSGALSTLVDASKSWTADEWIGDVVLLTNGPGSEESQNWRTITDSSTTTLTVSPSWNITHTTATEYVILGSDKWTDLSITISSYISDIEIGGEYIYIAFEEHVTGYGVKRYRFYNDGGTWSSSNDTEDEEASSLLALRHTDDEMKLYGASNVHPIFGTNIWAGRIPTEDGDLYHPFGELVPTNVAWDSKSITNVGQSIINDLGITNINIGAGFTTGIASALNLETPIDIRKAQTIRGLVKSSVNTNAGDIELVLDDVEDLGKTWSPVKVFQANYAYTDQPSKVYHLDEYGATPTYTDLTETYDNLTINADSFFIETDDRILIGYSEPFQNVGVYLGTANTASTALSIWYWNNTSGDYIEVAGKSDGTIVGAASFAQDGAVTWTMPANWDSQTINGIDAYWVSFAWTSNLDNPITVNKFVIYMTDVATLTPLYLDLENTYDGDTATDVNMAFPTEDYLYIGYGTKFNKITVDVGTINDIASVMTGAYWNGSVWTAVTITDGTNVGGDTLKQDGNITFTIPENWEANTVNATEAYWIRLDVSVTLSTLFSINEITVTRQNNYLMDLPALAAGVWEWFSVDCVPSQYPPPDFSRIASVGLNVAVDNGAQVVNFRGIYYCSKYAWYEKDAVAILPSATKVNAMEKYSGNVDDPVENPWIFTESAVYEMQTQNEDQLVMIPLRELSALQSGDNGKGHTVNGTYLYFNIGEKIERYFNRTLDDVGPDRDEGLPDDRPGIPISLASYPGRIYAAIDANTGTSSVLTLNGTSWSEVYRAPQASKRIRSIYIQSVPGTNVDRLWISMGPDVLWVPVSLNPYGETDFTFTHEGHLITSWIYAGMQDVLKLWKSLKIFSENISSYRGYLVDYQIDNETTWTQIGTTWGITGPVEEKDIASTLPTGRRIRYRIRFYTMDVAESPRLKALVTEGVAFVPVKYQFSWTFAITQTTDNINLFGVYDATLTSVQQFDQLVDWANEGQPLTFRHKSSLYDNTTVFIDPISVQPIREVSHEGVEYHVAQLSCIEV